MGFEQRYQAICGEVAECCRQAGRDPRDVLVLAVSKTVGVETVGEAIRAGAHAFGENRPDCLLEKHEAYPDESWHFIGNIQSRRIRDIVSCSSLVHSLCKTEHLAKFDAAAADAGKVQDVLIEVNVSGEASKSGFDPDQMPEVLAQCEAFDHVRVRGLMTMAPQGDLRVAAECFERLAELRDSLKGEMDAQRAASFTELSMGMSEDWREAIAAGSTIIRVGRALFSETF